MALPPARWLTMGKLPNLSELQLSHVSPPPGFCRENQVAPRLCRSPTVLLAHGSNSGTGGRQDDDDDGDREVRGAAQ